MSIKSLEFQLVWKPHKLLSVQKQIISLSVLQKVKIVVLYINMYTKYRYFNLNTFVQETVATQVLKGEYRLPPTTKLNEYIG